MIAAILKITFIDLVLSGDNAVVIAMASRSLPQEQQRRAIFWGGAAAIGLRVIVTALVAYMLAVPLLQLAGGLVLFWIACKLLTHGEEEHQVRSAGTLMQAITTIVMADAVMSLDNMLAVGGASHGDMKLLLLGLVISMGVIMFASGLIARLMNRLPVLVYIGAGILAWTAGDMILSDHWLRRYYTPTGPVEIAVPAVLAAICVAYGYLKSRTAASH